MTVAFEELPGTALPEGEFTITADENARLVEALGSAPNGGDLAHPVYGYVAAQRGIGASIGDVLALADFDIADGPMLASCRLAYEEPLRVGRAYRVTGEIVDVVRKSGRRAGTFDLLTVRETLSEDGRAVATVENVFVLPRAEQA